MEIAHPYDVVPLAATSKEQDAPWLKITASVEIPYAVRSCVGTLGSCGSIGCATGTLGTLGTIGTYNPWAAPPDEEDDDWAGE